MQNYFENEKESWYSHWLFKAVIFMCSACTCTCACLLQAEDRRGHPSSLPRVTGDYELPREYWDLSLQALERAASVPNHSAILLAHKTDFEIYPKYYDTDIKINKIIEE